MSAGPGPPRNALGPTSPAVVAVRVESFLNVPFRPESHDSRIDPEIHTRRGQAVGSHSRVPPKDSALECLVREVWSRGHDYEFLRHGQRRRLAAGRIVFGMPRRRGESD